MELLALAQRLGAIIVCAFLCTKNVATALVDSLGLPTKTTRIDANDVLVETMLNAQMRALKISPIGAILIRANVVQIANEPLGFDFLLLEVGALQMHTERTRERTASIVTLLLHDLVQLACPGRVLLWQIPFRNGMFELRQEVRFAGLCRGIIFRLCAIRHTTRVRRLGGVEHVTHSLKTFRNFGMIPFRGTATLRHLLVRH